MPNFTTAIYDAQKEGRANISRLAGANLASGEVEYAVVKYTTVGTEASADTIQLCVLPQGAIPIPALSKVQRMASPGTTFTITIGTAAAAAGWANGIVLGGAAGQVEFNSAGTPAWNDQTPIVPDTGSGNAIVVATLTTVGSPATGAVLYFVLAYKRGR